MRRYARVQDGVVLELFETDAEIKTLFNPELSWIEITDATPVTERWRFEEGRFTAPAASPVPVTAPTITELQLQIEHLSAQLSALGQQA